MPGALRSRSAVLALAAIVAGGTALRLFRLDWGLPAYNFPDDVMHFLRPAALAASGAPLRPGGFFHPPLLILLLDGAFRAWAALGGAQLAVRGMPAAPELATQALIGRVVVVAMAAASIALLYPVARRLVGTRAALLAALLLAASPLHVLESHRLAPDVVAIVPSLLTLLVVTRALETGRAWLAMAAGFPAGIAVAARYTAGIAVAMPLWAVRGAGVAGVVGVGLASFAGFALGCFPCLCEVQRFFHDVRLLTMVGYGAEGLGAALGDGWTQQRLVYPVVVALPYALGWPAYLAALAGLVLLWRTDRRTAALLLVVIGPFLLLMGASNAAVPRYYLQLVPFLAIAAGAALDRLWGARPGRVVVLLVCGYTVLLAASQAARLGLGPQRQVGEIVGRLAASAEARGDGPLVLAYPNRVWLHYDAVASYIRRPDVRIVPMPEVLVNPLVHADDPPSAAEWLAAEKVQALVVPSWTESGIVRLDRPGPASRLLEDLRTGRLGFSEAAHVQTHYLTEALYTWSDPILDTHWETGIAGYRVFVRTGE
jgi:hypothetical protein